MYNKSAENDMRKNLAMFERARELRRMSTTAERRLWSLLRGRQCGGLRFLRQAPAGHYVLDFYCPSARLCIEVDGEIHDLVVTKEYDREDEEVLISELSSTVLRLSNDEVLQPDCETLYQRIKEPAARAAAIASPPGERPARVQRRTR